MRIAIVGNGVVGGTLRRWLQKHTEHDLVIYDPPQGYNELEAPIDVAFVSVPVPTKSFKQDLSILREGIQRAIGARYIVVRSSVLPGTCDELSKEFGRDILAMPEFLTERISDADMDKQDIILGIPKNDMDGMGAIGEIRGAFANKKRIFVTSARAAEMAKYSHNCFGALKVTYFNAIYDLCKKADINFDAVRYGFLMSGYINDTHTLVPGPDGKTGFGGKCFPKDLAAFMGWVGANPAHALLKDVLCLNRFYRGEKDFDDGAD